MKTIFINATILTMNENEDVYKDGYLVIDNDKIVDLGDMVNCPEIRPTMETINCYGGILIPGLINTHTHIGMIPFRGLGEDLPDRLNKLLFPLEKAQMTSQLAKASAKYAIAEMQLSGITTFFDMYYYEDDIAEAAVEMRARAVLAETILENPIDSDKPYGGLKYAENFISKWINKDPLIIPSIAPHAPYTNTVESLQKSKEISDKYKVPYSIHLAEMTYEVSGLRERYNKTPVEFLEDIGFLSDRLIAAHCILVNEKDAEILAKNNVKVSHCLVANTKSAKGIAPIKMMQDKGVCVGLGTDGPISGNTLDLFTVMKAVALGQKTYLKDRSAYTSKEILKMATIEGARVLGLEKEIGSLEIGKKADLALIETYSINMYPIYDPYAAVVYQAQANNVSIVYVNGEKVVNNKKLTNHSVEELKNSLKNRGGGLFDQNECRFNDKTC